MVQDTKLAFCAVANNSTMTLWSRSAKESKVGLQNLYWVGRGNALIDGNILVPVLLGKLGDKLQTSNSM